MEKILELTPAERYALALTELRQMFPGQLMVNLIDAAPAVGLPKKSFFFQLARGRAPFPTDRRGRHRVVCVFDLAAYLAGKTPTEQVGPPTRPRLKRGALSSVEKADAIRRGMTTSEFKLWQAELARQL